MKQYVIVELVKTSKGNKFEKVVDFQGDYERAARMRYEELARTYLDTYFELRYIEHTETCLDFTKDRV